MHLYESNTTFPLLDEHFIKTCSRIVSNASGRGRRPNEATQALTQPLRQFYNVHYKPLLGSNPELKQAESKKLSHILAYEFTDIVKVTKTNVTSHFIHYAQELVNKRWRLKERLKEVDADDNIPVEQKRQTKRDISIEVSNFTLIFIHHGLLTTTVPSFM